MATKTAIEKGEERSEKRQEPGAMAEIGGSAVGKWSEFTGFLSDVRAEMRKVVYALAEGSAGDDGRGDRRNLPVWAVFPDRRLHFQAVMGQHGLLSRLGGSQ